MVTQSPQIYRRDIKINGASFSKKDVQRLFNIVQAQLEKAVTIQIGAINLDLATDLEQLKHKIREAFILTYAIRKPRGDEFSGNGLPDFSNAAFAKTPF